MCSNVDRSDDVSVNVEHNAQISFDLNSIHGPAQSSRKAADLVCAQARVERISFENGLGLARRFLLLRIEKVEIPPKGFRSLEPHSARGGVSRKAISISTVRSSSWSSTPCQNASGTSGCCSRRSRRSTERRSSGARFRKVSSTTLARSCDGRVLISLMTSEAVTTPLNSNLPVQSMRHV
jgi:hypothetical protein